MARAGTTLARSLPLLAAVCSLAQAQSNGPGIKGTPPSSKLSQVTPYDPWGLTALMDQLGFPSAYLGKWPYEFSPDQVAVDPQIDPAITNPIAGNDPAVNGSFAVAGNTGIPTAHAQPFTNNLALFIIRPNLQLGAGADTNLESFGNPNNFTWNASAQSYDYNTLYNMTDNTFENVYIHELAFCGGNTLLPDGRAFIVGGIIVTPLRPLYTWGADAVRIFDPYTKNYETVRKMSSWRWYPTVMTLTDGNMLILGGNQAENGNWGSNKQPSSTMNSGSFECSANQGGGFSDPRTNNPTYQFYYPGNNTLSNPLVLTILLESNPVNTYPFSVILPTGSTLIVAGWQMQALYLNHDEAIQDEAVGDLPPLPYPVTYPAYGSLAMLPLQGPDYKAEILIAGGPSEQCASAMTAATQQSILVDVTPGANHSVIQEKTNFPRVMSDLTYLPDGRLFLCNGAEEGIAGGTGPNYSAANKAVTTAEIYDPSKPVGQRWTPVADAQIWRMYHSVSFLTQDATVWISGSETTGEFRGQIWTPDYLSNGKPRPTISDAPDSVAYGKSFTFNFADVPALDRVVFQRLTGSTHGNHMDQRQVVLDCTFGMNSANCAAPPNSSIAPPGIYYLFALNEGVPSVAEYVSVGVPASAPTFAGVPSSGPSRDTAPTDSIQAVTMAGVPEAALSEAG